MNSGGHFAKRGARLLTTELDVRYKSRVQRKSVSIATLLFLLVASQAFAQADPLPSWNDGAAKKSIIDFVEKA